MLKLYNVLFLLLFFSVFSYCQIGLEDLYSFQTAKTRGIFLAKYDSCAWVAQDSGTKSGIFLDTSLVNLSICLPNNDPPAVYYGKINSDSIFDIVYIANLKKNGCKIVKCEIVKHDTLVTKLARSLNSFIKYNSAFFDSIKILYNFYTYPISDSIIIYCWPATLDLDHIYMCGGIKGVFNFSSLKLIENTKMHWSPMLMSDSIYKGPRGYDNPVGFMRGAFKNSIISEIDVAQSIIFKDIFPHQYIATKKYVFTFEYNKISETYKFNCIKRNNKANFN